MSILFEERPSESPYVESVTHGWTVSDGAPIRPAEIHWHMIVSRHDGIVQVMVVGPLTTAGTVSYGEGAELLWIKFRLGTFMPHLPIRRLLDTELALPDASGKSFYLKSSAWQFPDYENVETFVNRLVREEVLVSDPLVSAVLQGQPQDLSPRTVRHRFLQATGLTQGHVYQMQRAQHAKSLLQSGMSILDTVDEAGYYDQPHLTRSLKQWIGYTPAQIIEMSRPACHSVQDSPVLPDYDTGMTTVVR